LSTIPAISCSADPAQNRSIICRTALIAKFRGSSTLE
jgi:hypothetical protein